MCANIMKIIAIDLDRDAYEMELPIIKKDNIEHKINFIQSSALSSLDELLNEVSKSKVTLKSFASNYLIK